MVNRRIGKESSATRQKLLDAAENLMREEGYAQVTSRKLGHYAELKPQIVHYYFRTMDELFEALFRHVTDKYLAALEEVIVQENPLARLFELSCDTSNAVLHIEFLALANHRKSMHGLIAEFGRTLNAIEARVIRETLEAEGIDTPGIAPEELSTIIETVARGMAFAGGFNVDRVSAARKAIIRWLENFGSTYQKISEINRLDVA
ncbi:TetR/AcrR family transcriptional regulator [Sphingobium sufflavum]|uniref:TetR/AcrR family transcriptional regulator n=1 Tax=Sphingobium sufflavum TaxID=1129547 RepID=UPI001F3AB305|nr:TetR/AcrR family transcriptional regulator [Sphingobium sufflavum]MCE7798283.1 TetR/AcrR family transcriptional regulator [Sphingobium sufflavum]